MPLDRAVQRFLRLLAASGAPDARITASVAERRAGLAALLRLGGAGADVDVEERSLPGAAGLLPARLYTPRPAERRSGGLVYFHGGGHVAGSLDTHDAIARDLTQASGCRVVSVGYRLAPEHRYPAALDDAVAAVRHVAAQAADFGIDAARLGICGDSAGGTLAAAASLALADTSLLALQVLLCPILDYSRRSASRLELASGYLVEEATLAHDLLHYLPPASDAADPRISPLRAPRLEGLPPTVLHTAEFDPLRDEGHAYALRLGAAGVDVTYACHPGMVHLFYGLTAVIPAAATAVAQLGEHIQRALGQRLTESES